MWSYSGDPSYSDTDAVRFEIQDTDRTAPLLQDEELEYALGIEAGDPPRTGIGILSASARCCEVLARKFAMQADETVGSLQVTYSKMAETYAAQAKALRIKAIGSQPPFSGGQSIGGKESLRSDPDRVQPRFFRGEFGNRYADRVRDGLPPEH